MKNLSTPAADTAFLNAIIAAPHDDIPRLIYADYLEERGDPRGTFIRVQCERAGLTHADPRFHELLQHEAALFRQFETTWAAPVRRYCDHADFSRGFIQHVRVSAGKFLKFSEKLFRLAPIRAVTLDGVAISDLHRLADFPPVPGLESLELKCPDLGSKGAQAVTRSPLIRHLTALYLCGAMGPAGVEVIAAAPSLSRLEVLDLSWTNLGDDGAIALAASPHLANIRELRIRAGEVGPDGARALAGTPFFRLTHLDLSENHIANHGAAAIGNSAACAHLSWLDLHDNAISNLGIEAIARSPHLARLKHLNLQRNRINDRGIQALADATGLAELAYLNVEANEFGTAAAKALSASPHLPKMRQLLLGQHGAKRL